jgi:hypothetical protein
VPVFIVTHRPDEQPDSGGFSFAGSLDEAVERASAVPVRHFHPVPRPPGRLAASG